MAIAPLIQALSLTACVALVTAVFAAFIIAICVALAWQSREDQLLASVPPGIRRALSTPVPRLRAAADLLLALGLTIGLLPGTPGWLSELCLLGLLGEVLVSGLLGWQRRRRLYRRVCWSRYRVCTSCLYSLAGHGETGACPECGQPFTADELRETWSRWLKPALSDPPVIAELRSARRWLRNRRRAAHSE